jgi:hypothetical protein
VQKKWKFVIPISLFVSIAIVSWILCPPKRGYLLPENQIPHREMVFVDAASGPQQRGYRNVAGFIQGDGTGYTTRQIVFLDKEYAPFQYFPAFLAPGAAVSLPIYSRYTWDHDGGYLIAGVSRADPSHAEPILIFPDGEFMSCPDESFADLRIPPYFQPLAEMQIVGIDLWTNQIKVA